VATTGDGFAEDRAGLGLDPAAAATLVQGFGLRDVQIGPYGPTWTS